MKNVIIIGSILILAVVLIGAPLASSFPDGLEKVAETLGFIEEGEDLPFSSLLPDYQFTAVEKEWLSTIVAGLFGIAITFGIAFGFGKLLAQKKKNGNQS